MGGIEALVSIIAGGFGVPLLQLLKRYTGLSGVAMIWAGYIVSFVLAVLVCVIAGKVSFAAVFANPLGLFASSGIVMTTAQLFYRSLKGHLGSEKKK